MSKKIQIILTQDVPKLGRKNETKEVASGFARNYLLPRGLAIVATAANREKLTIQAGAQQEENKKELALLKPLLEKFETEGIKIQKKAGPEGKLFGSITAAEIAESTAQKFNCTIDKKAIVLEKPIKECGTHYVAVKMGSGISGRIKVVVSST